jgi:hypothetical protein
MGYTTRTFSCIQSDDLLYEAGEEVAINHTSSHKSFVILLPFWLNIETRCRNLAIFFFFFGRSQFWPVIYLFIYLLVKIDHIFIKKKSKQHSKGNFLENSQKNCHFLRKHVLKLPRFWMIWADF